MSKTERLDCIDCPIYSMSIFCVLNTQEALQLNDRKNFLQFKKGETVFMEGAYPRGLYCIHKGKIKITQTGIDGREQIVHLAKDADILGYRALLSKDTYSCSAVAMEDSFVCFISKELFLSLVENNPKVALQIIHLFSKELKETEKKMTTIAQRPVKERVAQSLLLLKEHYGLEKDNCTLNISITREEIANITGTTRESLTRALFELQKDQVIELSGKKIKILEHKALLKVANIFD